MKIFFSFLMSVFMIGSAFAAPPSAAPSYIPGTRLEGEAALFGQWEFEVTSLTLDEDSIHPVTNKVSVCLLEGMDEQALPLRAIPRVGRCIISNNNFLQDSIMISFTCDESGDVSGSISLYLSPQDDGSYEGDLDYVASPDAADYQINSRSIVRANRVGDCEASQ